MKGDKMIICPLFILCQSSIKIRGHMMCHVAIEYYELENLYPCDIYDEFRKINPIYLQLFCWECEATYWAEIDRDGNINKVDDYCYCDIAETENNRYL